MNMYGWMRHFRFLSGRYLSASFLSGGFLGKDRLSAQMGAAAPVRGLPSGKMPYLGLLAGIALAYIVTAKFGVAWTFEDHLSTAIWPPAGIMLAAFILWGGRIWPGVLIGGAVANFDYFGLNAAALIITAGTTIAPYLSARVLRAAGFNASFQTPLDAVLFALCGAVAPAVFNATVGAGSLVVTGALSLPEVFPTWWTWWVGDGSGALVITPVLLTWFAEPRIACRGIKLLEGLVALLTVALVGALYISSGMMGLYVFFPIVFWGALRFSQRENATMVLLVTSIVAWGAIQESAPGISVSLYERLNMLDLFIAVFSITTLMAGAIVAQRRRAEMIRQSADAKLLAESEARFRNAFDGAAIGMAIVSLEGRYLRVNSALCRMLGYDAAELLESTVDAITHPDDQERNIAYRMELLGPWINADVIEKRYRHKNGDSVWVLLSGSLVHNADGTPLHFVSQLQDITTRRQLEDQVRASQRLEAVGQLTAGIAHDFNNLLAVISLNLELISDDGGADSFGGARAQVALRACNRGAKLTRQLLAFARKQALSPLNHDLTALLQGSIQLLQHALPSNISIEMRAEANPACEVHIDQGQFENTILNIALNARDAMPGGGMLRFSFNVRDLDRDDGALRPGRYTEIVIQDTGCGMAPHVLARAFEPFFSTKSFSQGSGLGLSMAYGFVRQSGGDIRIASTEGQGATVTIVLPVVAGRDANAGADRSGTAPNRHMHKRILLVEDIADVRETIELQLQAMGFEVVTAATGAAALAVIDAEHIDALVTDLGLPGDIDGNRLADLAIGKMLQPRILTLTGYNESRLRSAPATPAPGRRRHLQKPFTLAQMKDALNHLFDDDLPAGRQPPDRSVD
jgi:PAS domain S-box-containing protein